MPEKVDFFDSFLEFLKAMEEDRRNSVKQEVQKASSPYGPPPMHGEIVFLRGYHGQLRWYLIFMFKK